MVACQDGMPFKGTRVGTSTARTSDGLGRGLRAGTSTKPSDRYQAAAHQSDTDLPADRNRRTVQLLLGHTKSESMVRYLGIEVDDALEIAEQTEM